MMKKLLFMVVSAMLFTLSANAQYGFGPEDDTGLDPDSIGTVVFVDSVPQDAFYIRTHGKNFIKKKSRRTRQSLEIISSREGKMIASYDSDELDENDEILHCVRMAMDLWEDRLVCTKPIKFYVGFDEDISPDLEIRTIVNYVKRSGKSVPYSLYHQGAGMPELSDSILINADVDWDYSWAYYSANGNDNLTTAMIRHIGHILGFGTSLVFHENNIKYAIKNVPSEYDKMLRDSQGNSLMSFARNNRDSVLNFMKRDLHLELPSGTHYPVYTQENTYVLYRSGNYFSLGQENVMNYPYGDTSKLLVINEETLKVLEAIGWSLQPHGIKIDCNDLDDAGYGSGYDSHTFVAITESGDTIQQVSWRYQKFSNSTESYVDVSTGNSTAFTIATQSIASDITDDFHCLQGRVLCSYQGTEYTKPVFLELYPGIVSLEIQNLQSSSGYLSFDVSMTYFGATSGQLTAANSGGWSQTKYFNGIGCATVHFDNVPIYGQNYVMATLGNSYGYCMKSMTIDLGSNRQITSKTERGISIEINGKEAEGLAILRDGDEVSLHLTDMEGSQIDEIKWQLVLTQTDGEWWTTVIGGSKTENSFVVQPSLFLERSSDEVNKFLACEINEETGEVHNTGYIQAFCYQEKELKCTKEFPVRFNILPSMPVVRMVRWWYAGDVSGRYPMWPVAEIEIDRAFNYDVGWIEVIDAGYRGIGGIFESETPMPHTETVDWGSMGDSYRVVLGNCYGITMSNFLHLEGLPTSIKQATTEGMRLVQQDGSCVIEFPAPVDWVTVMSLSGKTIATGKDLQRMQITAKTGVYLVRINSGNKEKTFKITIK